MMEPTAEDRMIDPDVQIVADNLPALVAIREACNRLNWRGEWFLCAGVVYALAILVEGETPSDSDAHRIISEILEATP